MTTADAVVIGGGFYGCAIALHLKRKLRSVILLEAEPELLSRASYANQARIHNGYHYPRSLHTAYRSRANFQTFVRDYADCVVRDFTKLYCVARQNSKVTARQFERFCDLIGAPWRPARDEHRSLLNPRLIEAVYETQEYAFNSTILRELMRHRLETAGVEVRFGTRVERIDVNTPHLTLADGSEIEAGYVFNCSYAGLKSIEGMDAHCRTPMKFELAEMALLDVPPELRSLGITVMCGPFFSTMPFPPRGLHTLSHVRYTPHHEFPDDGTRAPESSGVSRAAHMLHDASRYLPALARAELKDSLFGVKALLLRNEIDDGRPILMERSETAKTVYSIMGGKIDNICDVLQRLEEEGL